MPRSIGRVAFTTAAFISLTVCIATLGLWFHSTQRLDRMRSGTETRRFALTSKNGEIYLELSTASAPAFRPGYQHVHALTTQYRPPNAAWEVAGLGAGAQTVTGTQGVIRTRFVEIPLWPIAVFSAVLPVLWFDARGRGNKAAGQAAPPPAAATPRNHPLTRKYYLT